jgi:thiosulfate/3-mercaptopyruvate sulfurtransferase
MRKGHIPGAISIPWDMALRQEDGTFRNTEELREVYESACAIPRDNTVITYCLVGERSSHTWFVLSVLLGFPHVRNYDGSWCEWGSMIAAPIER